MKIVGIDSLTVGEVQQLVGQGGKFVVYQYCISALIMSFKRSSDIRFIRPGQGSVTPGLPYTLTSLFFGWWGIPWGLIWTPMTLATNLGGGKDVTAEVMAALGISPQQPVAYAPVRDLAARAEMAPAAAILTANGRLRCPACGYESTSTRQSCKNCRAPLLRAAGSA